MNIRCEVGGEYGHIVQFVVKHFDYGVGTYGIVVFDDGQIRSVAIGKIKALEGNE